MLGTSILPAEDVPVQSPFSQGLYNALCPAVTACDEQLRNVMASQQELATHIDRLASALKSFNSEIQTPDLSAYVEKLTRAGVRVKKLNSSVTQINARLEKIRASVRKNEMVMPSGGSGPQPAAAAGTDQPPVQASSNDPDSGVSAIPKQGPPASLSVLIDLLDWD